MNYEDAIMYIWNQLQVTLTGGPRRRPNKILAVYVPGTHTCIHACMINNTALTKYLLPWSNKIKIISLAIARSSESCYLSETDYSFVRWPSNKAMYGRSSIYTKVKLSLHVRQAADAHTAYSWLAFSKLNKFVGRIFYLWFKSETRACLTCDMFAPAHTIVFYERVGGNPQRWIIKERGVGLSRQPKQ